MILAYFAGVLILIAFTYLSYWKGNPVMFMLCGAISVMLGLYTPDALKSLGYSTFGVSIGLVLIFYSFVNLALAYINIFKPLVEQDED